jgi:hypothetical protein
MVGVAQLVERWIVAPVAEGSIPFAHPGKPQQSIINKEFSILNRIKQSIEK